MYHKKATNIYHMCMQSDSIFNYMHNLVKWREEFTYEDGRLIKRYSVII